MQKLPLVHKILVTLNLISVITTIVVSAILLFGTDTAYANDAIICAALVLLSGVFPALSAAYYYQHKNSKSFGYFPMTVATMTTMPYILISTTFIGYVLLGNVNVNNSEAGLAMVLPLYSFLILIESAILGAILRLMYVGTVKVFNWATSKK
ncbi:hypothetical protein OTK49_01235 [Vibrio coralliirubri]|uniref:hypothetical protein n=1 Tax=Vibrio coralliirubri TaxID=1516159 RepID=UPI0022841385|nr:hypothetical protein [Vibrio coralliirubri]MCY9861153.1 hypothetical protein [Vibrio coralliirubri]